MKLGMKISAILVAAAIGGAGVALAGPNGTAARDITAGTAAPNQGHFLCTAAINSDGTIATVGGGAASHVKAASTFRLGTGTYQVAFLAPCGNVQLKNGWFRVVQVDTLTTGSISPGTSCTVADRAGDTSAVFVDCGLNGTAVDTSFTISVSR